MTLRNEPEPKSKQDAGWIIAAGVGLLQFSVMSLIGGYTNAVMVQASVALIAIFGLLFELAKGGGDPAGRIQEMLDPGKLPTYDKYFGAGVGKPGSFAAWVQRTLDPGAPRSYESMFGMKASDLSGARSVEAFFAPKSMTSYGEIAKNWGFGKP